MMFKTKDFDPSIARQITEARRDVGLFVGVLMLCGIGLVAAAMLQWMPIA